MTGLPQVSSRRSTPCPRLGARLAVETALAATDPDVGARDERFRARTREDRALDSRLGRMLSAALPSFQHHLIVQSVELIGTIDRYECEPSRFSNRSVW